MKELITYIAKALVDYFILRICKRTEKSYSGNCRVITPVSQ